MSEERFDRMEKMMAQLIQMVGHNNAVTEELRQDVSGLKEDVAGLKLDVGGLQEDVAGLKLDVGGLKEDVAGLKLDVGGLKEDVAGLKLDLAALEAKMEKGFADIVSMVNVLGEKVDKIAATQAHHSDLLDVLAVRTTHQEAEIQGLKRAI
ncbi:hypothetical protein SOV_40140 [Sporomusa ovata DSM 2662]|uniref:Uncharacterized protein n=1 Tax=Sporomusa ovata TaxID=2378 RepID=A0A0U1KST4_9FIRM|nr:hypothetical protein [Sporomusa ovata]EQB26401.1 hypothetical protein SOV_3c02750 [Sporomusa ovata DSM 2662]CQR70482.1 hypothetical protein SpAn4DRAFT_1451 [Sporomusa ovata]